MKLPWGLRWWELLPEVLLGAGLTLFLVTETDAATSAFKSSTAIILMLLVSVGWLAGRILLTRFAPWPPARLAVFTAAAVAVLVVVVLPAYDDTTVTETLTAAETTATTTTTTTPGPATGAVPPTTTPAATPTPAPAAAAPTTAAAPKPAALRSSAIHGIDHRASGTAVIYRQPSGALVVGLENIDIQSGPDYDVYVVPGAGKEDLDGAIRLDNLRGNKGTQYYDVPAAADLTTGAWTVLVWCETFDVPVAGATPT